LLNDYVQNINKYIYLQILDTLRPSRRWYYIACNDDLRWRRQRMLAMVVTRLVKRIILEDLRY